MIEITKNLFVGDQLSYESNAPFADDWCVVHACKEPYHRQALGYSGRAAPKTHPEYLIATRGNRLILNMVDVDNPANTQTTWKCRFQRDEKRPYARHLAAGVATLPQGQVTPQMDVYRLARREPRQNATAALRLLTRGRPLPASHALH